MNFLFVARVRRVKKFFLTDLVWATRSGQMTLFKCLSYSVSTTILFCQEMDKTWTRHDDSSSSSTCVHFQLCIHTSCRSPSNNRSSRGGSLRVIWLRWSPHHLWLYRQWLLQECCSRSTENTTTTAGFVKPNLAIASLHLPQPGLHNVLYQRL